MDNKHVLLNAGTGCRMWAQGVLKETLRRQETRAKALDVLLNVIPWPTLTKEQEEALWSFFVELR